MGQQAHAKSSVIDFWIEGPLLLVSMGWVKAGSARGVSRIGLMFIWVGSGLILALDAFLVLM